MRNTSSSLRLIRIKGIEVFVHWSWFVFAIYEVSVRRGNYSSGVWNVLEYLALFAIVTAHEFGHALACRQTGGRADRIVLWPLGGVAFVSPPPRPGALLWSIAAGPLVNLALIPVAGALVWLSSSSGFALSFPDAHQFLHALLLINVVLFVFNMLPIYPLDGGQFLQSLLWYAVGRARSLMITVLIGFVGVGGFALLAFGSGSARLGLLALLAGTQCVSGFRTAQALQRLLATPRRLQYQCPTCKTAPPTGTYWHCRSCAKPFDPFASRQSRVVGFGLLGLARESASASEPLDAAAPCADCGARPTETDCVDCGAYHPFGDWRVDGTTVATLGPAAPAAVGPASAPRMVAAPSVVSLVLGAIALVVAGLSTIVAIVFIFVAARQGAQQPGAQAAIDLLWQSEGITLPGGGDVLLPKIGVYQVYLETDDSDRFKTSRLDIGVLDIDARPVSISRAPRQGVHRGHRELLPKGSFIVLRPGLYKVSSSTRYRGADDARIKVGPATSLASGQVASIIRGIAIIASLGALMFAAAAILLFWNYSKRRRAFGLATRAASVTA